MGEDATDLHLVGSPARALALGMAGVGMTLGSALLAFAVIPDAGDFASFIGWVGLVFFALCTFLWMRIAIWQRGVVVSVTAAGIRDRRLSDAVIPWTAVREVRTWEAWEQRFAVVRVDAQFESTFAIGRVARIMLRVNRGFGVNGFLISTQGLRGTFDALIGAIEGHFARASGGG